jgi:hypothetical protein
VILIEFIAVVCIRQAMSTKSRSFGGRWMRRSKRLFFVGCVAELPVVVAITVIDD